MSEFNEVDNIIEEETPVLHLELEDGTEQEIGRASCRERV